MRIHALRSFFLVLSLCAALPRPAASQATVTFNFDNGSPVVLTGQLVPLDQTVAGLTASFTSPNGPVYLVQSEASTGNRLTQFSGNYLGDHDVVRSTLSIRFNQSLTRISLTFATSDTTIEVPSLIQLTAYLNSNAGPVVGSPATARGTYAPGVNTWPMGTLTFDSGGQPFNLVEINLPFAPTGATAFFVDNIQVTTSTVQNRTLYTSEAAYLAAAGSRGVRHQHGGLRGRHRMGCGAVSQHSHARRRQRDDLDLKPHQHERRAGRHLDERRCGRPRPVLGRDLLAARQSRRGAPHEPQP